MEQQEWFKVNSMLRQYGLPIIDIVYLDNVSTTSALLTVESAEVLRQTLLTLMKDGNRRKNLLQEMLIINNQLRQQLTAQRFVSQKYEDRAKELQEELNRSYSRLDDIFEEDKSKSSSMSEEEEIRKHANKLSLNHVNEKPIYSVSDSKVSQLEVKCETYENEIHRLTIKLRKINGEQDKTRFEHESNETSEERRKRDKRNKIGAFDHQKMKSDDDQTSKSSSSSSYSGDNGTVANLQSVVKKYEGKLIDLKKEMKTMETKMEKLKLELLSRPKLKDLREAQCKIKQLQSLIHKTDSSFMTPNDMKHCSTLVNNLKCLPVQICRQHLQVISDEIDCHDLKDIPCRLKGLKKTKEAFTHLEEFSKEVLVLTNNPDAPCFMGIRQRSTSSNESHSHQIWCEKTLNRVLPTLEYWLLQLKQLKELQRSIKNLSEKLFPWKPVKLDEDVTTDHLIELVDSFVADESTNQIESEKKNQDDDQVTKTMLWGIVRHFQYLFDVPRIVGVYTSMNNIYRKLGETRNIMTTLKDFLGLDESTSAGTVVDAVANLCEQLSNYSDIDVNASNSDCFAT